MARKIPTTKSEQLLEQSVAIAEYAAKTLVTAEQLRIKTKALEHFPLEESERLTVANLPALNSKIKKKLAKNDATFTVAETASILNAVADSLLEGELLNLLALLFIAKKLIDVLDHSVVPPNLPTVTRKATSTSTLFQFKITLLDIKPAIWRRIQIPDCTLTNLHEYIQAAFGWANYHLHQFEIDGEWYSQPAPDGDDFDMDFEDETDVMLSELIPKSGRPSRWIYEYDFGDGWQHEVLFEGFPPVEPRAKYPQCIEGERACPPEDCGGPWGYADYLAAIADPSHEEHEELLEWRGPFDPDTFDAKQATKVMRKVK